MEVIVSPQGHKQSFHASVCKTSSSNLHKDLWIAVRRGSLADVDLALALLKKNGGSINSRNSFGLTPLHIATWRNHIPIVRKLLVAGADPNARYLRLWDIRERHAVAIPYYVLEILKDGESGWSSLHRALHFGHLAVASVLLQFGASITLEDSKFRTPVDLLSGPLSQVVGSDNSSVVTEVFSWGSGANYQLGTGNEHIQKLPCKVDSLHDNFIKLISASKFHSVAVSAFGEVYTWGFGRGGRLGHPDFDIHSGQAAVITPRQVTFGLGSRRVKAVAAAKHHTVIATESGDVFTWGSNREGQLGYTSVDTQPTPRRVSSLKSKILAVAAANKHTAVVSEAGEIFTWGCNKEGQLGYGTSNSASNYTPRVVEYLKGKIFVGVAAAKYHTIVLGNDGEVYTWGHRLVTPRRVVIARNLKKSGATPLKFHRMERLHVFAVAAGMVYSLALTDDGALFYWISSDPNLKCQQLYSLCGRNVVNISAGKYWTSAVTSTGDVYMWDGKTNGEKPPIVARVNGIKTATSVSVGETHLLIIGSLYHPIYPCNQTKAPELLMLRDEADEFTEDLLFNDIDSNNKTPLNDDDNNGPSPIPSLKSLCEKVAAECLVEPRNALQLLEIADSLGADDLKKHCEDIVIRNLAYIFSVVSQSVASAPLDILADLEKSLDLMSSEAWSHRRLPTPTATFPAIIYSEEENSESEILQMRESSTLAVLKSESGQKLDSFLKPEVDHHEAMCKQVRALRKKLQQIEMLEVKQSKGQVLDEQQIAKLRSKSILETSLVELGVPVDAPHNQSSSVCPVGKGNKSSEQSKRHRRKSKQKVELKTSSGVSRNEVEPTCTKDGPHVEILSVLKHKEEDTLSSGYRADETGDASSIVFAQKKTNPNVTKNNTSSPAASKKKNRKGGLSMFLSGALDDAHALKVPAPSPPTPKIEGPAWGGVKISKGSPSLREIQVEQSKILGSQASRNKDDVEDQIQSSSYFPSKPIPVTSTHAPQKLDGEKNTPPWAASGTPPQVSRPSLRDIQIQQQGKHSHSPRTSTAGFAVSTSQISPSDSGVVNRWFKPEVDTPSSIRSIQIEEKAMKDLRRFYSSVKIVKNQT